MKPWIVDLAASGLYPGAAPYVSSQFSAFWASFPALVRALLVHGGHIAAPTRSTIMTSRTTLLSLTVAAALLSAGCVSNGPRPDYQRSEYIHYGHTHSSPVIVYSPPPPPPMRVEVVPPPRPGHVWAPGRWAWENDRHRWVEGRWQPHQNVREASPPPPRQIIVQRDIRSAQSVNDGPRIQPSPQRPQVAVGTPRRDAAPAPVRVEAGHGRPRDEGKRQEGNRQEESRQDGNRQERDGRSPPRGRHPDRAGSAGGG